MQEMSPNKNFIRSKVSYRSLLLQLAEESAELTQAALKLVRAMPYSDNPTPVAFSRACKDLEEELSDVIIAANILGLALKTNGISDNHPKLVRWVERLKEKQLKERTRWD